MPKIEGTGTGGVPSGVIVLWSGAVSAIPTGWVICDGANDTPDLTDRFVLHADADSGGTNDVGDTGAGTGATDNYTLLEADVPAHRHYPESKSAAGSGTKEATMNYPTDTTAETPTWGAGDTDVYRSTSFGGSGAHSHTTPEIKPKFYALAYIMKS